MADANDGAVWFITGTSSGFGASLVEAALAAGYRVVCAQRDVSKPPPGVIGNDRASLTPCDVTKPETIHRALQATLDRFGTVDVLVNNAGFGMLGALEELDVEELRAVFETNLFGVFEVTKAVLPIMRAARRGHILNVSSIAGLTGFLGSSAYCASKFALEGLSESLAMEVAPFGIKVTLVEPGAFRTEFAGRSIRLAAAQLPPYAETVGKRRAGMKAFHGAQQGDPRKAAEAMIAAVQAERPPLHLLLGPDAVDRAEKKLDALRADLDAWRTVSTGTDFAS